MHTAPGANNGDGVGFGCADRLESVKKNAAGATVADLTA
jgi:hypothetical protein